MTTHDPKTVAALDALEAKIPQMLEMFPDDGQLLEAIANEGEAIEGATVVVDCAYLHGRIDCMLKNAGLIPGEEEGEPCQ